MRGSADEEPRKLRGSCELQDVQADLGEEKNREESCSPSSKELTDILWQTKLSFHSSSFFLLCPDH